MTAESDKGRGMKNVIVLVTVSLLGGSLLAGCGTARKLVDTGLDVKQTIEARKEAERSENERARLETEKAEADRIAAERAAEERKAAEEEAALVRQYADGPNTIEHGMRFLWKPVSESNGKPVIILGQRFTHKVEFLTVDGQRIPLAGIANGWREHYRTPPFTGPVTVALIARDGNTGRRIRWTWSVPDSGQRWDNVLVPVMEVL